MCNLENHFSLCFSTGIKIHLATCAVRSQMYTLWELGKTFIWVRVIPELPYPLINRTKACWLSRLTARMATFKQISNLVFRPSYPTSYYCALVQILCLHFCDHSLSLQFLPTTHTFLSPFPLDCLVFYFYYFFVLIWGLSSPHAVHYIGDIYL